MQEVPVRAQTRWDHIGQLDRPGAYVRRMVLDEFPSWRRRWSGRVVPVRHEAIDAAAPAVADPAVGVVERDAAVVIGVPSAMLSRSRAPSPAGDDGSVLPDVRTWPNLPSPRAGAAPGAGQHPRAAALQADVPAWPW